MIFFLVLLFFYFTVATFFGSVFYSNQKLYTFIAPLKANYLLLPFLGLSLLISVSQTVGIVSGTKYLSFFLITFSLMFFLAAFRNWKGQVPLSLIPSSFSTYLTFVFLILVVFIYSFPSIMAGFPTSFASINNDLIFYLSIPEWLRDKSYFASAISDPMHPFFSIAETHFSRFSRVGADYFNTLGMNIFNVDAVHTFNVISCFFVVTLVLSVYYTCRYSFRFSLPIVYTAVVLTTINSLLFWMFTTQYMPQIAGNTFYVLALGLIYRTLNEDNKKLILPTSIIIAGLISVYSEYVTYLVLPLVLYLLFTLLTERTKLKHRLLFVVFLGIISILINPVSAYLTIRYNIFAFTTTQNSTGIVENIPFFNQILMVFGIKILDYSPTSFEYIFIALILLAILLAGFYRLFKLNKRTLLFIGCFFAIVIAFLLYLKFINKFPYGYYKTLMLAQPLAILIFSIAFGSLWNRRMGKILYSIILAGLLLLNLKQIAILEKAITKDGLVVTKDYLELEDMSHLIPKNEVIFVDGFNKNEQHIISYYLRNNKIIYNHPDSYFMPYINPEIKQKYVLTKNSGDIIQEDSNVWNNSTFGLLINPRITLGEGWNGLENWNGIPSRWTTGEFQIRLDGSNYSQVQISFDVSLPPGVSERTLSLYVKDQIVDTLKIKGNEKLKTKWINVVEGPNIIINGKLMEGAVKVGQDPRNLGIGIQNLTVNSR